MWTSIKLICFLIGFFSVSGFMFDDPCNVFPRYSGGIPDTNDFTTTVEVPANCRNGSFRWDYPKGHAMLEFQNVHKTETEICIKDSIGGDIFNITDKATNQRIGKFDYKHWSCTSPSAAREILLQVDAPNTQYYVGAFEYRIQQ